MKILKTKAFPGESQLATYMKQQKREEGWLMLFDARKPNNKVAIPERIQRKEGTIKTIVIDINPTPPHKKK